MWLWFIFGPYILFSLIVGFVITRAYAVKRFSRRRIGEYQLDLEDSVNILGFFLGMTLVWPFVGFGKLAGHFMKKTAAVILVSGEQRREKIRALLPPPPEKKKLPTQEDHLRPRRQAILETLELRHYHRPQPGDTDYGSGSYPGRGHE